MKRIDKRLARRLFNEGTTIHLITSNMNPNGMWGKLPIKNKYPKSFDKLVNEFEHYNCNYETGYYTHFYIEEDAQ